MSTPAPDAHTSALLDYEARVVGGTTTPLPGRDQLVGPEGARTEQALLTNAIDAMGLPGLLAARAECRRLVDADAIRYGSGAEGEQGRNWVIDPLPVVLTDAEWRVLDTGLQQRARLLDAVLADVYGPKTLIRERVIPAEVILGHPEFIRQVDTREHSAAPGLVLSATDLTRNPDGYWLAISDRTSAPSGAGYAMATRRIVTRVMAGMHRSTRVHRLRGFFHHLAGALQDAAPDGIDVPKGVLLSPGSASETAYEHAFLSTLLGFPLVEAGDLRMRDGRVWVGDDDRLDPVDVVLRRVDSAFADPLELRGDSRLGLPGLLDAARRGTVSVANPVGAGVLENPGLMPYLRDVCRHLLGEDLRIDSAQTWWCGDPASRQHVVANLDSLVIKSVTREVQPVTLHGRELDQDRAEQLRRQIEAQPWMWVAQEHIDSGTTPVVTDHGLIPRRFVLRTFTVARGGEHHVMPGGLGRAAGDSDSLVVSNATGAPAKDVWVLAGEEDSGGWYTHAPRGTATAIPTHGLALPPRVAENLFWMGRYTERVDGTTRLVRVASDLAEDHESRPGTPGWAVMEAVTHAVGMVTRQHPVEGEARTDYLRRLVRDQVHTGTVAHAVRRLVGAAQEVRDQVSRDVWQVLSALEHSVAILPPSNQQLQPALHDVVQGTLAMSGIISESMVRDASWGYLDAGARLERAQNMATLLCATIAIPNPPTIDGQVCEATLDIGESVLSHRRRTVAGEGPAWPAQSALALLLHDPTNPRSVRFQLERLVEDLELLADPALRADADAALRAVGAVNVETAAEGDRAGLQSQLGGIESLLRDLATSLALRHFRRPATQASLPQSWTRGVRT